MGTFGHVILVGNMVSMYDKSWCVYCIWTIHKHTPTKIGWWPSPMTHTALTQSLPLCKNDSVPSVEYTGILSQLFVLPTWPSHQFACSETYPTKSPGNKSLNFSGFLSNSLPQGFPKSLKVWPWWGQETINNYRWSSSTITWEPALKVQNNHPKNIPKMTISPSPHFI